MNDNRCPINFLLLAFWSAMAFLCLVVPASVCFKIVVATGFLIIVKHYVTPYSSDTDLLFAAGIPLFLIVETYVLNLPILSFMSVSSTPTYDTILLKWDLGIAPYVRSVAMRYWWPAQFLTVVYYFQWVIIPLMMTVDSSYQHRLWFSVPLGGILVVPCYLMFPAVGPIHIGELHAPCNCMPSMHLTWALLLYIYSQGKLKPLLMVYVILTAASTLSTGEHYVPDLVAAIPWTAFIVLLTDKIVGEQQDGFAAGHEGVQMESHKLWNGR